MRTTKKLSVGATGFAATTAFINASGFVDPLLVAINNSVSGLMVHNNGGVSIGSQNATPALGLRVEGKTDFWNDIEMKACKALKPGGGIITRSDPIGGWELKIKDGNFVVTMQAYIVPNLDFDIDYDESQTYFCGGYNESTEIVPWYDINIKDMYIVIQGNAELQGRINGGLQFECLVPGPIPILPIGVTGLSVYLNPKVEILTKLKGKITTPTYGASYGPINTRF